MEVPFYFKHVWDGHGVHHGAGKSDLSWISRDTCSRAPLSHDDMRATETEKN